MISTKPKEEPKDRVAILLEQYIALEQEERSKFLDKATQWLIKKIEADNLKRQEEASK